MQKIQSLIMLLCFGCSFAYGQQAMRLSDCIDYAYQHHTDVRVAQLSIKDADWQIKENRAAAYPNISANLNLQRFIQVPEFPAEAFFPGSEPGTKFKFALENSLAGNVRLDQLLFNSSYLVSIKAAKMYRDYVGLQLAAVKEKVRNMVIDAYLPALLVTESIEVFDRNIKNQERLFMETKATYEAGFLEKLDVDRVEYLLSTLRTERESLARQKEIVLDALKFAIHMPLKEELVLQDDMDALLETYALVDPDETLDYMSRPDYVTLLKARELSQVQVEVYQKDWLPTLSLFASYDPSFQGNDELYWVPSAIVGVSVHVPIYDGGLSRAKEERATIAALKVDEQKNLLTHAYDLSVETARKQFRSAKLKLEDQMRNMELAERIQATAQTKYREGIGSSFEVTQTEMSYLQAQGSLINARYEYLNAIMALRKALGKS